MKTLKEYLSDAKKGGYAIGHFNFATEDVLRGIVEVSMEAGVPCVMVGTSEGEVEFFGMKEAVAVVKAMREHFNYPVFLNADHFKNFEKCKEAIDTGYDSVIIDTSKLPYEENVASARKTVEYAKSVNPAITVEGELGYLKGSSEVQQKIEISAEDYTKPEMAQDFVDKTGVSRLAVVFGNIHGIVTDQEEKLDIEHFRKIVAVIPVPKTIPDSTPSDSRPISATPILFRLVERQVVRDFIMPNVSPDNFYGQYSFKAIGSKQPLSLI